MTSAEAATHHLIRTRDPRLEAYRAAAAEKERTDSLLRLMPSNADRVLEVGSRDGYHTMLLAARHDHVTALDLSAPSIEHPNVTPVAGDVTRLSYADGSFDCVVCAEVLEHVPDLRAAGAEIARVTRHAAVIGVPYRQDLRFARTTCSRCCQVNPPWAHLHAFDEARLASLFPGMRPVETHLVGEIQGRTTALAAWFMDRAGNPWGSYDQDEPCIHCGAKLAAPRTQGVEARVFRKMASRMNDVQAWLSKPSPRWLHCRFEKI